MVGPSMLVLGDIPAKYGLSVSLLERLHRHYQRFGAIASSFHGSLVTNYRSRSEILSFTGKLFYDLELRISSNQEPSLHPGYRFPLVFVCTDVEDATIEVKENVNQREVVTTVRTLSEIIRSWPNKLWGVLAPSSLCIMSPSRAQLALLNEHIDKKKMPKLKQVKRLPTFDIQGREFRALLLSTSEPIDSHGSTKNPLKSFSNPYVFNTAITRAQSLVIAFGNPFQLLKMEDQLIDHDRAKGKRCWSTFINLCLREGTVVIDALQTSKKQDVLKRLETWVKLRLPEGDDLIPTSPDSVVSQPMPSPPPQLATSVEISPIPPNVQQGTLGRTKLNEKYNKKEISKPQFANEPKLGGGFTCTVRCRDNKTNKEYEIKGSGTSKAGSKEVAARALLDALGAAVSSVQSASAIPVNTSRSAAINSKTKQPLAVLKELCDKRRFKYEVSTEKNSIPGATNIGFVAKISITDKMSSQIKIQSTSDSKATKKEAAHDSAAKAIELLKLLNTGTLEILEPDDGEFVFTREEKEQVPAQRVAEADPNSTLENMGYDHVKKVASGGFGVVHLVKSTTDGQTYALKIVKLPYLQREQDKCMEEVKVLATLKHANILGYNYSRKVKAPNDWKTDDIWKSLQYVNALSSEATSSINAQSETSSCGVEFERDINVATSGYDPPMCLCIFTEYCEKGTLEKWLYATTERSERSSKIVQFFDQLLQALRYLHGDNAKKSMYIHRDLKPSNIFITQDGENTCLKVGDFGLVKHWPGDLPSVDLSNSAAGDESQSVSRGGTRLYMSPEQLAGNHFDEKVDMYALGLILFELLYPMRTEREKSEVFKKLRAGMIPGRGLVKEAPDMSQLPVVARVIIKGLIKQDPTMRLSAKSLLESGEYQKFKQKMKKKS